MGMTAVLLLGPRDGEKIQIVEPQDTICVMTNPAQPQEDQYDEHIYLREKEPRREGVWYYQYAGVRIREQGKEEPS